MPSNSFSSSASLIVRGVTGGDTDGYGVAGVVESSGGDDASIKLPVACRPSNGLLSLTGSLAYLIDVNCNGI